MRVMPWVTCWIALTIMDAVAFGQGDTPVSATSTLDRGPLTVWVVRQVAKRDIPGAVVLDNTIHQQTAGSFGQTAGSYGTTASNHGQTAGSFGQPASNVGQDSGNHGQTAGSFGQTAGSYGTAASNHGQTAGSFGHSLSTIADAGSLDAQAVEASARAAKTAPSTRDPLRDRLQQDLKQSFYDSKTSFITVSSDLLMDKLAAAEGQAEYPDVIVGQPLPTEWRDIAQDTGIVMLGSPGVIEQENNLAALASPVAEAAILLRAPHPDVARAFVVWLHERGLGLAGPPMRSDARAAAVAVSAVKNLMSGSKLNDADPALAQFSPMTTRIQMLAAPPSVLDELSFRIDVLRAAANERFAVVALRVVASSDEAFGVVHPLVVLRRAQDGRWKVLQISPNLASGLLTHAFERLYPYTARVRPDYLRQVAGISQAAPLDGDSRPPMPELWWDNGGGGSLLIVEWQLRNGSDWSDSRMYFIADNGTRAQTRATAQFANGSGAYHWRVWTVGSGGVLKLSPWRTLNIGSR